MQYQFGDCELNTAQFTLRRADTITPLSAQACDVLHYLIAHRSRVVSKKELADQLWLDTFVSDGAIETMIKRVRRATGDTGRDQNVIQTLRGKGYRFVAPAICLAPKEIPEPLEPEAPKTLCIVVVSGDRGRTPRT